MDSVNDAPRARERRAKGFARENCVYSKHALRCGIHAAVRQKNSPEERGCLSLPGVRGMLATLSIIIRDPGHNGARVNAEIGRFRGSIAGRLGLPFADRDLAVIVLVLDADLDAVNVLSGRIGRLPGTSSRVMFEPEA